MTETHAAQQEPAPSDGIRSRYVLSALTLAAVVVVACFPAMQAGFIWDDDAYVTDNTVLSEPGGLSRIWTELGATPQYYPLVFTSFLLEYQLWGLNPTGYHIVNVLLHAASAIVLWRLLVRLEIPAAWYAAALFAVHPVNVETVAWVTERKNTLSLFLYLLAATAWFRWSPPAGGERGAAANYWLSLLLFAAALCSKTVTFSLPAAILLIVWWKRGSIPVREILPLVPMLILGVAMGLITRWVETHHVGTRFVTWDISVMERILIAGRVPWFYAQNLVWPVNLTFIYPKWNVDDRQWWQFLFPAATLAAIFILWFLRSRIGRGGLTAVLFFVGTLFPAMGFVDVYPMRFSFVADHFQYLAAPGLLVLFATLQMQIVERVLKSRRACIASMGLVLMTCSLLTWRQCLVYQSRDTLWQDTMRKNPNSQLVHTHLGIDALAANRLREARVLLKRAVELDPNFEAAHLPLGIVLAKLGELDLAETHLKRTIELDPNRQQAYLELAIVHARKGHSREFLRSFQQGLRLTGPKDHAGVCLEAARELQRFGRDDAALILCRKIEEIAPGDGLTQYNLGVLYEQLDRQADAEAAYQRAITARPFDPYAHFNLGNVLARQQRFAEAVRQYESAVRLKPDFIEARRYLRAARDDMRKAGEDKAR